MTPSQKANTALKTEFDSTLKRVADQNKPGTQTVGARPFLKWVGGKRSVLPALTARMPQTYKLYREPFVGGGALFFCLQPTKAYISDINFHLALTYQAIRDDIDRLILNLKIHTRNHNKPYFQKARERISRERDETKIAALLIYLNKTCYNGLYRVNKKGGFNVPMGSYKNPTIFDEEVLRADSQVLQNVELQQHPFWQTPICRNDFYYLDPPYHQVYASYDSSRFREPEHERLAKFCKELDEAKAYFMLSNSDTPFVRNLFSKFHIEEVAATRSVSCKGKSRGKETELVIRNYE